MIQRTLLQELPKLLSFFSVLGIIGSRQVGKTTLAKTLATDFNKPVLYLDLENRNDFALLDADPQWYLEQQQEKLVIIDEVQRMLSLFPLLRSLIDQNPSPSRFVLLGSVSPILLAQSSETLAGRIVYRELTPIRADEAQNAAILQQTHWLRGGYPKALTAPDESLWYEWQDAFVKTYIESDLQLLGLRASPIILRKLLQMLVSIHSNILNYSQLANSMGLSSHTVTTYLDFLEHSFVLRRLQPYFTNIGKRLVKSPKVYFRDTGLLHYLSNINSYDALITHILAGHSWEGYVIEQIIGRLAPQVQPYFYRTQNGAEIDLCLLKNGEIVACFEIKLSNNPSSSKGNTEAVQDLNCSNNFIVTPSSSDKKPNALWQVCSLDSLWSYLIPLEVLR